MFTDGAYAAGYTGCEPFGPGSDYDIMNTRDYEREDAPQYDDKPYGWGFDQHEDPALAEANRAMWDRIRQRNLNTYTSAGSYLETWGMFAGKPTSPCATVADIEFRDFCYRVWTKRNARLEACSGRVWSGLCDRCDTHAEAVAKYTAWADKVKAKLG